MMKALNFLLIFVLISFALPGVENNLSLLHLKSYLGKEELAKARQTLEDLQSKPDEHNLIVVIDSSAGDLISVLELAKSIYELKVLKQLKVIVYLNDNVVGPAAILPFLADRLYSSLFVSWGDIPLGTEGALPTNILRNRVRSLIDNQNPQAFLLYILADAMSDPSLQVVEHPEKGWVIERNNEKHYPVISASGQTLVINQNQLKALELVSELMPPKHFYAHFDLEAPESIQVEENKTSSLLASSQDNIEEKLKKIIQVKEESPNTVGYIHVGDHETMISESTWIYIRQALEYYKLKPPSFIILELNTPGGEVFAAQKISDALKDIDTQYGIPVVAFINNWAISAGAMLAYSSRFIATVKDGSMGAAEPVYAGEGGKFETASEKVNSAIRADFANRARFFDRNPLIAEAMVDKDLILVLRHGRVVKLDSENQIRTSGPDPDIVISPKGKLLTLDAEQMIKYGVADILLMPEKLSSVTAEEKEQGRWPLSKTLLSQVPFFKNLQNTFVDAYKMDWKTQFFVFLATPLVSSLLFMGLIIGAYIEINSPGFGLPSFISAFCLFFIAVHQICFKLSLFKMAF